MECRDSIKEIMLNVNFVMLELNDQIDLTSDKTRAIIQLHQNIKNDEIENQMRKLNENI